MLHIIITGSQYLFLTIRTLKLVKNAVQLNNSTNPLILLKNITLTVLDCYSPIPLKLVTNCIGDSVTIVNRRFGRKSYFRKVSPKSKAK